MNIPIALQESLRPVIPKVKGCKDYRQEQQLLERVNKVLVFSGVEQKYLEKRMAIFHREAESLAVAGKKPLNGPEAQIRHMKHSRRALRCTVLKGLVGGSYRELSKMLAMSPLYRWFCHCEDFEEIQVPGKSTLADYATWLPLEDMEEIHEQLRRAISDEEQARIIGLENELDLAVVWLDSTCLKANIHFPTDWIVLRDMVSTTCKCIATIRRHGLKHRIGDVEDFQSSINAQCMAMAASRRKPGGKKQTKSVLRRMKRICKTVREHGKRYRKLLDENWSQSDLSRKDADVILARLDNVLNQAPAANKQAHERIIGERVVANEDKILSLYEPDLHVIVRGKSGAEVEFGNSLFVAENADGFILHHQLLQDQSPGDSKWLSQELGTIGRAAGCALNGIIADRGFASRSNHKKLEALDIFDGLCPRNPRDLEERFESDEVFVVAQRRRAQSEGRIGILKNAFLDGVPRAKGFKNRSLQVSCAVLAHNLWVVARLKWVQEQKDQLPEAA